MVHHNVHSCQPMSVLTNRFSVYKKIREGRVDWRWALLRSFMAAESEPFALGSCGYIVRARAKVNTDSGSSVYKLLCSQSGKMG